MKNADLCSEFVAGTAAGKEGNSMYVSYDGKRLYSYSTIIAQKLRNGVILVNDTHYSVTSCRHQSHLRTAVAGCKVRTNKRAVPYYTRDLKKYC